MIPVIVEVALTAVCAIIGGGTLYILKGFSNRLETLTNDVASLRVAHSALDQRVKDNEGALSRIRKDVETLENDNKNLLAQINDSYQKIQVSIEELKLRNAEMAMQFKQSDITHADIKRDVALIASHLYGKNNGLSIGDGSN